MQNKESIDLYLSALPEERRKALQIVRGVIVKHLPKGFEESFAFGMITYELPLATYPKTYNKKPLMYAGLASQKNHLSLYLTNVYSDEAIKAWFVESFQASGKKLDMGKSCLRFQTASDLPLDLVGEAIAKTKMKDFIAIYEASRNKT